MEKQPSAWETKGKDSVLVHSEQNGSWLIYDATANGLGRITAIRTTDQTTKTLSENEIDCAGITAAVSANDITVVWVQLVEGVYQLFEGSVTHASPRQITHQVSSVIHPVLSVDQEGSLYLAYQAADVNGIFQIYLRYNCAGCWSEPFLVSDMPGNNWDPDITCCDDGKLAIAWDGYSSGSYDIYLRFVYPDFSQSSILRLTGDDCFNAHVNLSPAPDGSVWIVWNSGTPDWGKDNEVYRKTRIADRNYLHTRRFLEMRRVFPDKVYPVFPPVQDVLDQRLPGLLHEQPRLFSSPEGPLYLMFRFNEGELSGGHRNESRWQGIVTCYNGDTWSECVKLEGSAGLSTTNISLAFSGNNQIFAAVTAEGGETKTDLEFRTKLYSLKPFEKEACFHIPPVRANIFSTPGTVETPKRYGISHNGEMYNLYFGETHRHTEVSFCRASIEGSLEEAYRYAKDAAALDFVMTADHDHQQQTPDMWNETMRNADKYHIPGHFTTFFGYEWIGGHNKRHRNILSTERVPVPPFTDIDGNDQAWGVTDAHRDVRDTWHTLQKGKAITIPHHTACGMGLIWNKDPGEAWDVEFEPIVEIFQASRSSSEYPNCPTLCNSFYWIGGSRNFNFQGGFVSDALQEGLRMGFIASSDHMTTHRSYACVYAEENTRESLVEAMKQRRTYAATDRIICEFRIDMGFMGEEITPKNKSTLDVCIKFVGTGPLREVSLLCDSTPWQTWFPEGSEVDIRTWIDAKEARGHYYYARLIQEDTNMAWASPIWVD